MNRTKTAVKKDFKPVLKERLAKFAMPFWQRLHEKNSDGASRHFDDVAKTKEWLMMANKVLKGISASVWPKPVTVVGKGIHSKVVGIGSNAKKYSIGKAKIELDYDDDKIKLRRANIVFSNDDHTVWVIETKPNSGVFKNFDIGGS